VPGVDAVFTALADPTRRSVLETLAVGGSATATSLASGLPVSRQAVAKHLCALQEADLVSCERVGRETRYTLEPAPLTDAARWMAGVGGEWDRRLAALGRMLAS
jgi:DNA-binding transcriptional ArsR family regulator